MGCTEGLVRIPISEARTSLGTAAAACARGPFLPCSSRGRGAGRPSPDGCVRDWRRPTPVAPDDALSLRLSSEDPAKRLAGRYSVLDACCTQRRAYASTFSLAKSGLPESFRPSRRADQVVLTGCHPVSRPRRSPDIKCPIYADCSRRHVAIQRPLMSEVTR
jgi:hypothetical protein